MAVNEGLAQVSNDQVPIDPNVRIPDHVRQAAAAAEAFYKQPPADPDPAAEEAARAEAARLAAEAGQAQPLPADKAPPAAGQDDFTGQADQASLRDSEWARRYNSMHGRWQASERSKAAMEQQMTELAQELVRTQNMLAQGGSQQRAAPAAQPQSNHNVVNSEEDRANYGDELLDVIRRTAQATVSPEIARLEAENARLTSRVQSTGRRELFETLDRRMPTWRATNTDPKFIAWLRLRNVYTGQVRGEMLKAAVDGAQAPKVLALFQDFLTEAHATGMMPSAAPAEQQQQAPHAPALDLETLAAPGRARPASGDSQLPADKKFYSRADISNFYNDVRKGLYAGRDAVKAAYEADLTAAQREGRIR